MLKLSQDFGGARVYECNIRNDDGSAHYHISGRPTHVYGGRERPWERRQRHDRRKKRRRNDDDPDESPVGKGRGLFVAEIAEVIGAADGPLVAFIHQSIVGDEELDTTDVIA